MADDDELDLRTLSDEDLTQQMHDDLYDGLKEEIEEGVNILGQIFVAQFLCEGRIVRQLELAPAMRAQTVCFPDLADRGRRQSHGLAHRPDRPVRRFMRRRSLCQTEDFRYLVFGGFR